jgi:hypothetical protein
VSDDLERMLGLVRRELGAAEAHVRAAEEDLVSDELHLSCRLPDGRGIEARFDAPPSDREAKQRRLEMLAATLDSFAEDASPSRRSRPPVAVSLHDELGALCRRAGAVNALVIDANSPVVWGAAFPEGVVATPPLASSPRVAEAPANDEGLSEGGPVLLSRRAVHAVRGWPELGALRKGRHMRKMEQGDPSVLAHSFASIYIVLLVFDVPFDELRAERAVIDALPRIEGLVLALPPLDPEPTQGAGALAMRRPRRR